MKKQNIPAIIAGTGFLILVLDTKTAITGAAEGVEICLKMLVPSLLPFLFLSGLLVASLQGKPLPVLHPISKLLRLPKGAESIFLIGLLGGYPVGAQCVAQAVSSGSISRENGKRMIAFCSNAGPAFIFGIGSRLFDKTWMVWMLWLIHMIAALLVGSVTYGVDAEFTITRTPSAPAPAAILRQAIQTMAMICGWVIIFRVLLSFLQQWFMWWLPDWAAYSISGLLEIANGCFALLQIENTKLRFLLCSTFLGFGGLCVTMQTYSVCSGLDCRFYLPGKFLQTVFSILLSTALISREMILPAALILSSICLLVRFFTKRYAKKDSNPHRCVV